MCVILSIVVVLLFLWDRGQATGFPGYQLKDMLLWGKDFVFVFLEKVIKVFILSRVIWIRFDRGRPQKGYLDDTKILFGDLYMTEYSALVNFIVRHAELT